MKKLVQGVGFNDADYQVKFKSSGGTDNCKFYQKWHDMLKRCYCKEYKAAYPTYSNASVCKEWLTFSNFKAWMEKQDWEGNHLDKDLLVAGNKVYSPSTCLFISPLVNNFITDRSGHRGSFPLGVCLQKTSRKLLARCRNPFTKTKEHLGTFSSPEDAHLAWKNRKHELACQLADLQTNKMVADALRSRYANAVHLAETE